ncbi:hypothetical protein D6C86_02794 [Aureobasidium pullulans]|uniref:F-box domain-containing protein n=1 Tax=Aureobasidium pullulans TaxID=5580 RepID=A0A4S9WEF3_AURPU|nr:hypothetical protein D6C94_01391 [Aureobasidium pullulans]THZ48442.1 hypothetical protein D6C87_00691 [Aureobasidium pullulans]THZ63922.1 hypothetical protein D6C86_02794 [Aureobasidium pullulans]
MATMLALPQEVLARVFDHVDKKNLPSIRFVCSDFEMAGNPRFAKEFLTRRRHTMSLESISTMHEIVSHSYFGSFVDTIILNCVRTVDRSSTINDIVPSGLAFRIAAEETRQELITKALRILRIIQAIKKNHGKINIGVCFENSEENQHCFGLKKLLSTTGEFSARRAVYSSRHLGHNIESLIRICKMPVVDCPINLIEVDLGSHAPECPLVVQSFLGSRTIHQDINDIYRNTPLTEVSLCVRYGRGNSNNETTSYDHKTHSLKWQNKLTTSSFVPMGYSQPDMDWLRKTVFSSLEMIGSPIYSSRRFLSMFLLTRLDNLQVIKLQNVRLKKDHDWSAVMMYFSWMPNLKRCHFSQLSSQQRAPIPRSDRANFLDIILYEADGPSIRKDLQDLSARLQPEETAWNALADDNPRKYTSGFGAKIIHNSKERNSKNMSHPALHIVAVRHGVKRKSSITADELNGYPVKNVSVGSRDVLHFTAKKQHFSKDYFENLYRNSEKPLLGSMALKVAKSQIPIRTREDMLDIPETARAVLTTTEPEHNGVSYAGRSAAGNSTPVADQESSTGSFALVESTLDVRMSSNLHRSTTTRAIGSVSSLEKALERLSLTSDKQPPKNKPSRIVTSKIPKTLCQDVLKILSPGEVSPLTTGIGHCKNTPVEAAVHGETIAIANQHLSEGSVGVTEETLRSRKHSTPLHSVLDNPSNKTSLLFTQARSRYVLEEVQDVGDTDDWAEDLCTRINTISVSEEQEKPTTAVQSGSIMFMGAVRTEDAETDDWADEIGWDLDQVLKKHQEKA